MNFRKLVESVLQERITKHTPTSEIIKDFQKSDAPQFRGKSQEKRRQMAIAASYAVKEDELDEACWKGYKQLGMKTKSGKQVPNCVKEDACLDGYKEDAKKYLADANKAKKAGNLEQYHLNMMLHHHHMQDIAEMTGDEKNIGEHKKQVRQHGHELKKL